MLNSRRLIAFLKLCFTFFLVTQQFSFASSFPLHTCGKDIVDKSGDFFKLISINWYGASEERLVPGGLNKKPLVEIVGLIKRMGFNSVRLPFSNQMLEEKKVDPRFLEANPDLIGKTPLEVFDEVVKALARENIAVILNNHTSHAIWCCLYEEDGLWYTKKYSEERWVSDWEKLVARYQSIPQVIGADLRNEVRVAKWKGSFFPTPPLWGTGTKNDWRRASEVAGNRILSVNPNILVIVEGVNFPRYHLRGVKKHPVRLKNHRKLVYAVHNYAFPSPTDPFPPKYGDMPWEKFKKTMDEEWGFVLNLEEGIRAPVWVSEWGGGPSVSKDWFQNLSRYMKSKDVGFAYWPLNAGDKLDGQPETFSLLKEDWSAPLDDWRWASVQKLQKLNNSSWSEEKRKNCRMPQKTKLHFHGKDSFEGPGVDESWKDEKAQVVCGPSSTLVQFEFKKRGKKLKSVICQRGLGKKKKETVVVAREAGQIRCPQKFSLRGLSYSQRMGRTIIENALCQGSKPQGMGNKGGLMSSQMKCVHRNKEARGKSIKCNGSEKMVGLSLKKGQIRGVICCF